VDSYTYRGELLFVFKNRTDTDLHAYVHAVLKYNELPAWKKPFTSIRKIWNETADKIFENPLKLAPYNAGDRIGQLVFFEHPTVCTKVVEELSKTERGEGGFGSTGK
jgi:dUTPase